MLMTENHKQRGRPKISAEEKRLKRRKDGEKYTSIRILKTTFLALNATRGAEKWDNFLLNMTAVYDISASPQYEVIELEIQKAVHLIINQHKK